MNAFMHLFLVFISTILPILLSSLCSCKTINNENCIKNSTFPAGTYPPFFKGFKICERNMTYTLVPLGDNFSFNCSYDSNPRGEVFWSFGKRNKQTGQFDVIDEIHNTSRLTIKSVSLEDEGHYTCTALNALGWVSHSFFLHVADKPLVHPIFKHKEEEFVAAVGDKVNLDCAYETEEFSSLQFYKANRLNNYTYADLVALHNGRKRTDYVLYLINSSFTFDQLTSEPAPGSHSLTIDPLNEQSFGIYMCLANNRYGKSVKFINLKMKQFNYGQFALIVIMPVVIFFLVVLLVFVAYRKYQVNKKLIIEKGKSYIITKRIIIDFNGPYKQNLLGDATDSSNIEMNSYNFPHIEIVKERKEIVDKAALSEALNKECYDIPLDEDWEIDPRCLELGELIGEGHFGVVQRAIYRPRAANQLNQSNQPAICQANGDYVNESLLNYNNPITNHFTNNSLTKSLTNNITAFSNNYYDVHRPPAETYGRLELVRFTNETHNNGQPDERDRPQVVAVKKLKLDHNDTDVKNFISEMELMKKYSQHENIINLIGTCTRAEPFFVIMEYAEHGNLREFLREYKKNNCRLPITGRPLTFKDLVSFAGQIALGMKHLADNHCIHRDLAARNVLVTSDLRMKVSDFGFSRTTSDSEYYRKSKEYVVPVKWMAPESIKPNGLYTTHSDVWSFGVTMWEITSLGSTPYGDRFDQNCMLNYLWANNRMNKPMWCNDEMYALMQDCWNWEPKDRPLFDQIIERLHAMYNREGQNSKPIVHCNLPTPDSSINSLYSGRYHG